MPAKTTICCGKPVVDRDGEPLVKYRPEAGAVTCIGCFRIYMPLSPAASRAFEQSLSRKLYGTGKKKVSKRISKKASKLTPGGKR